MVNTRDVNHIPYFKLIGFISEGCDISRLQEVCDQ